VLDASFHGGVAGAVAPPPLFAPWGAMRNRVVRAAGRPDEMAALARSGAGLVLAGPIAVAPDGRISPDTPALDDDWPVEEVHAAGAQAGVVLTHAGRRGSTRPSARGVDLPLREGGWPLVAPSAIAYAPRMPVPRVMDAEAMTRVCDEFAQAARGAAAAGFDVLELDMGHGYLLASFLSPESNRREDEYGGDLAGRIRFPLRVLDAVREEWSGLLAVRLNVIDGTKRGLKLAEGIAIARELAEHGCGLVHVVAGQTVPEAPQADYRRGFLTPLADRVRAEARVPTLVGGYLTTPDEANTILGAGRADLCLLDVPDTELERQVLEEPPLVAVAS
jgi:anthraniloyl-CoA monooxygenase